MSSCSVKQTSTSAGYQLEESLPDSVENQSDLEEILSDSEEIPHIANQFEIRSNLAEKIKNLIKEDKIITTIFNEILISYLVGWHYTLTTDNRVKIQLPESYVNEINNSPTFNFLDTCCKTFSILDFLTNDTISSIRRILLTPDNPSAEEECIISCLQIDLAKKIARTIKINNLNHAMNFFPKKDQCFIQ